ncbi:MAG: hypothetical protein KatS3mg030_726 [Saprospiraceae bacterium]|nr:MAG: hypothetical protein KatS3mg030_425 [Saprospiraceae bacterium]GIV32424.1 MAG: hypothetical protein KatS3mg030_726 [Saprospiraceae bacterium]
MVGFIDSKRVGSRAWKEDRAAAAGRLFFPLSSEEAKLKVEQLIGRRAELYPDRSRWTLDLLHCACYEFIPVKGRGAFKKVLKRLSVSYQRARIYFHSPDTDYETKLAYLQKVIANCREGRDVVLAQDELTYYNHASPAPDHAPLRQQPRAALAIGGERKWRVIGALNLLTGEFTSMQRNRISVPAYVGFLCKLVEQYPGKTIYLLLDNWPVHFHPEVIEALQPQQCPYPFQLPRSWAGIKPSGKYRHLNLPVQLVPLPTYASWLNPVEKIWRWLKKDLIHNHSFANDFKELQLLVDKFLAGLASPSRQTLSVAGLLKPNGIFAEQLQRAGLKIQTS